MMDLIEIGKYSTLYSLKCTCKSVHFLKFLCLKTGVLSNPIRFYDYYIFLENLFLWFQKYVFISGWQIIFY